MNEHALNAMIYAWLVMKEKEENKMEGIFMGQITGSCSSVSEEDGKRCAQVCFHDTESNACSKLSHYNKTYSLVLSDDVIMANDELLKLREKVAELEEELIGIKTTRTLREAYIAGVEKGCESLREERDYWKRRCNSVMTDISNTLSANGIELTVNGVLDDVNWKLEFDIPELNEAKKEITYLKRKLKAVESKETFWRDRKEEEEDYHHYWLHTFDRVVKQAAEKGIHIGVRGTDEDCNAGVVVVDNVKAEELEKQVVQMEDANQKLRQRISAADEEIEKLKNREGLAFWRNAYYSAVEKAKDRGDYWKRSYDDLAEYWDNTCKDLVARGKTIGMDSSEAIDATAISCGTVPKCSSCAHYMHNPSRFAHDWCYMPIPKEGGAGYIRKLNKEEAEGPACVDFKAKE